MGRYRDKNENPMASYYWKNTVEYVSLFAEVFCFKFSVDFLIKC
jgi:hypothetical protein